MECGGTTQYTDAKTGQLGCYAARPCWDSTCSNVYNAANVVCKQQEVPGAASYDGAVRDYCNGVGMGSWECQCMNFSSLSSTWCERAAQSCRPDVLMPQASADDQKEACYAQEFMQEGDGNTLEVIQFSKCNPLACWYGPCVARGPNERVVTTHMLETQLQGCSGVCLQAQT